jgi:hypothetical protein
MLWMTLKIKELRETPCYSVVQKNTNSKTIQTMNKEIWSKILNIVITVLTAIATTFGVTSCMGV